MPDLRGVDPASMEPLTRARHRRAVASADPRSVIAARDHSILRSLRFARFLSTAQIARLHFPSRRVAQRRLRALLDHGLVRAHIQGEALQRDNVFTLTPEGRGLVTEDDEVERDAARLARPQKLRHALAIRDAWVASVQAFGASLLEFSFEEDLARDPGLHSVGLVPDARAVLLASGVTHSLFLEVDLGTETTTMLRQKFALYGRVLASAAYDLATLVVATTSDSRVRTIDRVVTEVALSARTKTVRAEHLLEALVAYSHEVFAPTGRAVRTDGPAQVLNFSPVSAEVPPAFRPLGRG